MRRLQASDFELLPKHWSDTDQRIFECLLLAQPSEAASSTGSAPLAAPARSGNKVTERKAAVSRRKKAAAQEGSTAVAAVDKQARRQQQQPQPREDAGKSAAKKRKATRRRTSLDERKFKHREVQRRFMERKKVRFVFVYIETDFLDEEQSMCGSCVLYVVY